MHISNRPSHMAKGSECTLLIARRIPEVLHWALTLGSSVFWLARCYLDLAKVV
jgi:hypothetical protein